MRALSLADGQLALTELPTPVPAAGEALLRVTMAGICNTDLELSRGYMSYAGVLGHELCGVVERCDDASWVGKRVAGEINLACGRCETCGAGLGRHCPTRTVLGIVGKQGCFAEHVTLPVANLHALPDALDDLRACFVEPTAAAFEILEQVELKPRARVVVLGDGKLGLLVSQVLAQHGADVIVVGRHARKLAVARWLGLQTAALESLPRKRFDVVVDATGSPEGLQTAVALVRPRGTVVLKSTFHGALTLDAAPIVIDELTLIGSRCGPFEPAIAALASGRVRPEPLIDTVLPLADAVAGMERAATPGTLKVLLDMRGGRERHLSMGPLTGIKVIEVASIGPGPFAAMMLADMGADVLRLDRIAKRPGGAAQRPSLEVLNRGRPSAGVDLKQPAAVQLVLELVAGADVLIEGFRPGVMERLGLGPELCLAKNERLVYGRMTGWGQDGPLAQAAGHDIDYIALAGALHAIGRAGERPLPPLNLIGDFGGGGMLLAFGVASALVERQRSGRGQVVDAAMVDGAATLMSMFFGMQAQGYHREERGTNLLDTGAHFYDVYETADGKHVAVGALEPQFYAELLRGLGLHGEALQGEALPPQMERASWPAMRARFAAIFKHKTRDEWSALFDGKDACVAPVLSMREAAVHPHLQARGTIVERHGVLQAAPAPRFDRTPAALSRPPSQPGADTDQALCAWGVAAERLAELRACAAIG